MLLYRITREKYAEDLTGEGARLWGGRWNRPGLAVIYTSEARSLALLEMIVHFNAASALSMNYVFVTFELDEDQIFDVKFPTNQAIISSFNNKVFWNVTDDYFVKKDVFAIRVPSVIISKEFNVLVNPNNKQSRSLKILEIAPAIIDQRLLKTL